MKGDITAKVLSAIGDTAMTFANLFDVFISAGYGASINKIQHELATRERYETQRKINQRYSSLLYALEKQDLIRKTKHGNVISIYITKIGKEKLTALKNNKKENLPPRHYKKEQGEPRFTIVAFDIPEKDRRKRDWLRSVLSNLQMKMIQKSVWSGKIKLPKEFLEDLRKHELIEHVEIFEVTKSGSLRHVD